MASLSRRVTFLAVGGCLLAAGVGGAGYLARPRMPAAVASAVTAAGPVAGSVTALAPHPGLMFSSDRPDRGNGFVELAAIDVPDAQRFRTALRCERLYYAAGVGVCLAVERGVFTAYSALTFGPDFTIRRSMALQGVPSRVRISPDGRRAAITLFVVGDSYNSAGFSTRTTILDVASGRSIADLEEFAVTRAGARFKARDFNFWGVTFARDGNRFFATLRSGTTNYLVEGDVDARTAQVLREGVECPSLSPDNTRLVFKKRINASEWRLHVLDLATMRDEALGETRSVDDQAEWLDDQSIAYTLPETTTGQSGSDVWTLSIGSAAPPRLVVRGAHSPVAVHAGRPGGPA
jgi:hypothetical protein